MMKTRRFKLKYRKNAVRITFEPDYDHDAWASDTPPTPDTVPDAFYQRCEPAHPKEPTTETRRSPHPSLSASMLRKRLYSAGIKGAQARQVLADIMAGEQAEIGIPGYWSVPKFREQFGRRVARAVLRFVRIQLIILDEFAYYVTPGLSDFVQGMMSQGRKHAVAPLVVEQTLPPPVAVARRISFRF